METTLAFHKSLKSLEISKNLLVMEEVFIGSINLIEINCFYTEKEAPFLSTILSTLMIYSHKMLTNQ